VRQQALAAAGQSQNFGGLFLGFSIFLIVAALLLMALLFQFGIEQRATEVGTLLALGFTPRQVRRLLLLEGGALSLVGGLIGVVGGIWYARTMLLGFQPSGATRCKPPRSITTPSRRRWPSGRRRRCWSRG